MQQDDTSINLSQTAKKAVTRFMEFADQWMVDCSKIAMSHYDGFDKSTGVMTKSDDSPLTKADLEVDAYLYKCLTEAFPDIPVVTEERSESQHLGAGETGENSMFFLVDPIDGTKEFINKRDEFTVNIALINEGTPIAGVVCAPALKRSFAGSLSGGAVEIDLAKRKRKAIMVSKPDNEKLMVVASRSHLSPETKKFIESNKVADTKSAGSSLKFCLLACGEADLYPRFGPTMEWDTAAGHAVLLAAGGIVENLDGTSLQYGKNAFRNPWFIARSKNTVYQMPKL